MLFCFVRMVEKDESKLDFSSDIQDGGMYNSPENSLIEIL